MARQYALLVLTCADKAEASKITSALLDARLIACAKVAPVDSIFWWKGEQEQASEVLLIMESAEDLFTQVELVVKSLHSYDTFVLEAIPLSRLSSGAADWLKDNLKTESD